MTIVYAIILFVLLIFPHELGHFVVAKAVGVKVNEFAFGMGPAIYKRQKRRDPVCDQIGSHRRLLRHGSGE